MPLGELEDEGHMSPSLTGLDFLPLHINIQNGALSQSSRYLDKKIIFCDYIGLAQKNIDDR